MDIFQFEGPSAPRGYKLVSQGVARFMTNLFQSNDATNNGDYNKIVQKGQSHYASHKGDDNKTGQEGFDHNNEVEGNRNITVQLEISNANETKGNDNKTGQNGRRNHITTDGNGYTYIQYANDDRDVKTSHCTGPNNTYIKKKDCEGYSEWIKQLSEGWAKLYAKIMARK